VCIHSHNEQISSVMIILCSLYLLMMSRGPGKRRQSNLELVRIASCPRHRLPHSTAFCHPAPASLHQRVVQRQSVKLRPLTLLATSKNPLPHPTQRSHAPCSEIFLDLRHHCPFQTICTHPPHPFFFSLIHHPPTFLPHSMAPKNKGKAKDKTDDSSASDSKSKLKPATSINVRHILCEKHSKKEEALEKLRNGAKFDDVAREMSEDKARQGTLHPLLHSLTSQLGGLNMCIVG